MASPLRQSLRGGLFSGCGSSFDFLFFGRLIPPSFLPPLVASFDVELAPSLREVPPSFDFSLTVSHLEINGCFLQDIHRSRRAPIIPPLQLSPIDFPHRNLQIIRVRDLSDLLVKDDFHPLLPALQSRHFFFFFFFSSRVPPLYFFFFR